MRAIVLEKFGGGPDSWVIKESSELESRAEHVVTPSERLAAREME